MHPDVQASLPQCLCRSGSVVSLAPFPQGCLQYLMPFLPSPLPCRISIPFMFLFSGLRWVHIKCPLSEHVHLVQIVACCSLVGIMGIDRWALKHNWWACYTRAPREAVPRHFRAKPTCDHPPFLVMLILHPFPFTNIESWLKSQIIAIYFLNWLGHFQRKEVFFWGGCCPDSL